MGKVIMSGIVPNLSAPLTGILASTLAVGSSVYMNENGSPVEYLVVNQGIPSGSSVYDSSCDGTWLLRKDIHSKRQWHTSSTNKYESSDIHSYLNGTFRDLFDAEIKALIKQVKLPYRKGGGSSGTTQQGANGLSTQIFLLSFCEANISTNLMDYGEGASLSYFADCDPISSHSKRIAYFNGSTSDWWLRSPSVANTTNAGRVNYQGGFGQSHVYSSSLGVRPALILPFNALFDKETLLLKGVK